MKYETINGTLCRMVKPEPIFGSTKAPFVIVGKNTKHPTIITQDMDILLRIFLVAYSDEFEIIGYPVQEGSHWWALWQAENGKSFVHKDAKQCRIFTMFSERELRISDGEGETVEYVEIDKFLNDAAKDGWQLYEPEPAFKVGGWVEFIDAGGRRSQGKYLSNAYDNAILVLDIAHNMRCVVPTAKIIRKLDPSEVNVKVTLEGTVSRIDGNNLAFELEDENGVVTVIGFQQVKDTPTRELVQSLLKAQEEK